MRKRMRKRVDAPVPVHVDLAHDRAVHVEPDVRVRHPMRPGGADA